MHATPRVHYADRRRGGVAATGGARSRRQKTHRVAYLAYAGDWVDELGYSEGRNLIFDLRSADGNEERLRELAMALAGTNPDFIIAGFGTAADKSAQASMATIPIVFTSVGDPIASEIVKSLNGRVAISRDFIPWPLISSASGCKPWRISLRARGPSRQHEDRQNAWADSA